MNKDKNSLRRKALRLIAADGHRVGTRLAQAGGVSRQVANAHLPLVHDGFVEAEGTTRARVFAAVHPQIRITPLNTAPAVAQMVEGAVAARVGQAPQGGSATAE